PGRSTTFGRSRRTRDRESNRTPALGYVPLGRDRLDGGRRAVPATRPAPPEPVHWAVGRAAAPVRPVQQDREGRRVRSPGGQRQRRVVAIVLILPYKPR